MSAPHFAFIRASAPRCRLALIATVFLACVGLLWSGPSVAKNKDERPWLGISMSKPEGGGVRVEHVFRKSPAAKANLQKGDHVTHADGVKLESPRDLANHIAQRKPGMKVSLAVRRGGKGSVVEVILEEHPGSEQLSRLMHVGEPAYELVGLTAVQGKTPASIQDFAGQVVLLDFFAGWCGNCKKMTPELARLDAKFAGMTVFGVTSDEEDVARDIVKKWKIPYAVASDGNKATFDAYSVTAIPDVFVIDKKGIIRDVIVGYDPSRRDEIEKLISDLIAEK